MISEGARVALPFIVVDSPGQVTSEDFARGALSKPTAMVDAHVRAILDPRFRVHNARVHDFSPHGIEIALGQTFYFGLLHIGSVQREEFSNAVVFHVPAYVENNMLVMYSNNCVKKKHLQKRGSRAALRMLQNVLFKKCNCKLSAHEYLLAWECTHTYPIDARIA